MTGVPASARSAPILIFTGGILSDGEQALIRRHRAFLFHKPEGFDTLVKFLDTLTGELRIPVLTVHTMFDPVAPFAQEAGYAKRVKHSGASSWLAQRVIRSYGHCNINANEAMAKAAGGDGTIRP